MCQHLPSPPPPFFSHFKILQTPPPPFDRIDNLWTAPNVVMRSEKFAGKQKGQASWLASISRALQDYSSSLPILVRGALRFKMQYIVQQYTLHKRCFTAWKIILSCNVIHCPAMKQYTLSDSLSNPSPVRAGWTLFGDHRGSNLSNRAETNSKYGWIKNSSFHSSIIGPPPEWLGASQTVFLFLRGKYSLGMIYPTRILPGW